MKIPSTDIGISSIVMAELEYGARHSNNYSKKILQCCSLQHSLLLLFPKLPDVLRCGVSALFFLQEKNNAFQNGQKKSFQLTERIFYRTNRT